MADRTRVHYLTHLTKDEFEILNNNNTWPVPVVVCFKILRNSEHENATFMLGYSRAKRSHGRHGDADFAVTLRMLPYERAISTFKYTNYFVQCSYVDFFVHCIETTFANFFLVAGPLRFIQ